jgi:hypothetical protein
MATTPTTCAAGNLRRALCASTALHVSLLGVLLADSCWPFLYVSRPPVSVSNLVVLQARTGPRSVEIEEAFAEIKPDEGSENLLTSAEADRPPEQVFGDRTAARLAKAAAEAQERSPAGNQQQLEKLAGKLSRVSSEKSVDEMAGKLRNWLGTQQRAERPAERIVAGEFEYSTAQLHDVRREQSPEAGYVYFAILVDAAGRRVESRMDSVEGESAYKTLQLVKANPLAEMVYRRIVMGFLDNVIKAGMVAQEGVPEAEAAKPPAEVAPVP